MLTLREFSRQRFTPRSASQAFAITIGFILLTELVLSMALQSTPNPIMVLIFLPIVALLFTALLAGCFLLNLLY